MIYEFWCSNCNIKFEKQMKLTENVREKECPKCSKMAKKVPSLSSFQLKGTCWEKDGYSNCNKDTCKNN